MPPARTGWSSRTVTAAIKIIIYDRTLSFSEMACDGVIPSSLAPFLIVATERVFFGYGWFYNLEDGYIPCPKEIECGMPTEWFPEYSKPLGEPLGAATTDASR